MKRSTRQATLAAYTGMLLLLAGFYPSLQEEVAKVRVLHALWHLTLFVGAALLIYGLETLRSLARRYRRMVN